MCAHPQNVLGPGGRPRGEDGRIDSLDSVLLAPHDGDLAGFFIVHGEQSALDSVRSSPEFLRVTARAEQLLTTSEW